jgi:hypothetical protein
MTSEDDTNSIGATPDPFDPASLRLGQDFALNLGVKKALLTIPVRKPSKESWVRVHPNPDYSLVTTVIELKEEREFYLVAPALRSELASESAVSVRRLFTAVTKQGVIFIWPAKLPGPDGRSDAWSESAIRAAEMAKLGWVRVQSNMPLGAYEVTTCADETQPEWPGLLMAELLRVAFKDRYIDSLDHPVLRRLRGES